MTFTGWLRNFRFLAQARTLRAFHVLERHYAPIGECDGLIRNRNTRRNVSIIERIVEGAAEKDKRVPVMVCPDKGHTGAEAVTPTPRPVRPPIGVWSSFVGYINPGLGRLPAHIAYDLAFGPAPGQPHRILRHACADLALTYQRLITGRKALINFGMLGNAVLSCLATRKNQCAGCEAKRQRLGKNSTFHADDHMCCL